MCVNWFKRKPDPIPLPVKRRLLTFGKNKYGGGNDLNGCVHDSENISKKVLELFPDFDIRKFTDNEVTVAKYKSEVTNAIAVLNPGATVLVLPDSCFSETSTRALGAGQMDIKHPTKNRFIDLGRPPRKNVNKLFSGPVTNHIVMSGCSEHETSADAYINSSYVGAFTFFTVMALKQGMTYKEWFTELRKYLPSQDFGQTPTLEGPEYLLNRKVFESETLVIHNSSHGSYTTDLSGDEVDGYDEGLYFDYLLIDDDIGELLKNIP